MIKKSTLLFIIILSSIGIARSQTPLPYELTPASGTVESLQSFELIFPEATKIERNSDTPLSITIKSSKKDAITGEPIVYQMNGLMLFNGNKLTMSTALP